MRSNVCRRTAQLVLAVTLTMAGAALRINDPACHDLFRSCVNHTTVMLCTDVGFSTGIRPYSIFTCPASNPVCNKGYCGPGPTTTTTTLAPRSNDPACHDLVYSCLNHTTVMECTDWGAGLRPYRSVTCPASNPVCDKGTCGPGPTTTTTTTTTTTPPPRRNNPLCNNSVISCLDYTSRVLCADLGAGLTPVNIVSCPASNPVCNHGLCGPEPTTTTPEPTTTTPQPSDPCAGREMSCADARTLRWCADLGAGLIPVRYISCPANNPVCNEGFCRPEPSSTTTTARPDPCAGGKLACLDAHTRLECSDVGAGLVPVRSVPCPADSPVCNEGVCEPAPTTATPPSDPCAGGEWFCADAHTQRACGDLGDGLIPLGDFPCTGDRPLCVQGRCVRAQTF